MLNRDFRPGVFFLQWCLSRFLLHLREHEWYSLNRRDRIPTGGNAGMQDLTPQYLSYME